MSKNGQDKIRIFGCRDRNPLHFLVCGQMISPAGFMHHRRKCEFHVLLMVMEGTLYMSANGVPYVVSAGQYIFLKAGEEHFGYQASEGRLSYLWVHFQSEHEPETIKPSEGFEEYLYLFPEYAGVQSMGRTAQLFHQLMDLSLEENLYSERMLDYSLSLLIMEFSQEYVRGKSTSDRIPSAVISVMEWIKNHYYQSFDVAEPADAVGYHADYLSALFKRSTGMSMVRYTNQLRIKHAKTLLTNYDVSIKEAAYSCGFSDEKYFMKVFKQTEGMTPTQFKKAFCRKNIN